MEGKKAGRWLIQTRNVQHMLERQGVCVLSGATRPLRLSDKQEVQGYTFLPPGQSCLSFYFLFIFWCFILHLLVCLLCFNLCGALTTTRLWFVLPSEFPLMPLVSSNTHFFFFFFLVWNISSSYQKPKSKQENSSFQTECEQPLCRWAGEPIGKAANKQISLTPTICPKFSSQVDSRKCSLFPFN